MGSRGPYTDESQRDDPPPRPEPKPEPKPDK